LRRACSKYGRRRDHRLLRYGGIAHSGATAFFGVALFFFGLRNIGLAKFLPNF
jgi:hypothetical protein